jgi:Mn-dependent DtxR family transcriptional regulator
LVLDPDTVPVPREAGSRPPADLRHHIVRDRDVLAALASRQGAAPVFDADLAAALSMPEQLVAVRLASLVSLGLVDRLMTGKDGGYTLTDLGRAHAQRSETHDGP